MASNPLPVNLNPSFQADMPGAIVYPAHTSNYYLPENHGGIENQPRAFILHTPEEPWDDNESTPNYFRSPNRQASTHYYQDSDGDIYQLVPERCAAIANGLLGKPRPSWAGARGSLNWMTLSVEIEGYASSIQDTLKVGGPQWRGLVTLIRNRCLYWNIPLDREHIMGHYQLSTERVDPGAGFPWDALIESLKDEEEEDEMPFEPKIVARKPGPRNYIDDGRYLIYIRTPGSYDELTNLYGLKGAPQHIVTEGGVIQSWESLAAARKIVGE